MCLISHNKFMSFVKRLCFCFPFLIFIFLLTSCTSMDKKESYFYPKYLQYSCTYQEDSDETTIVWTAPISNNTIYRIEKVIIYFDLYQNGIQRDSSFKTTYSASINPNKTDQSSRYFQCSGKIDQVKYVSWTAIYDNLWETYFPWWIAVIVAAPVLALVYFLVISFFDLNLNKVIETAGPWVSLAAMVLIPSIVNLFWDTSNWFPYIIGLVGAVGLVVLCLLASGAKALAENLGIDVLNQAREKLQVKAMDKAIGNVRKCRNNKELLMRQTEKTLSLYCDSNDIRPKVSGKIGMVNAIVEFNKESRKKKADDSESKVSKRSKKTEYKGSTITFKDIAGLEDAKKAFREKVILPFEHPELFKKYGKKAGGGILLYGLPGTGKTRFAEACANEADALFIPSKCSDIKSKWYGESEQKVKQIFGKAKKSKTGKAIIFFDEFEAIGAMREENANSGNNDLVPEILAEMQGIGSSSSDCTIVVLAATNKPWAIDSAFLRPGRFDQKIYIPLPDLEARKKLFELKLNNVPAKDLDLDVLAKMTEGYNGADITEFVERLKMNAINMSLESGKEKLITREDVNEVAKLIKSSVNTEDIERLEKFEGN